MWWRGGEYPEIPKRKSWTCLFRTCWIYVDKLWHGIFLHRNKEQSLWYFSLFQTAGPLVYYALFFLRFMLTSWVIYLHYGGFWKVFWRTLAGQHIDITTWKTISTTNQINKECSLSHTPCFSYL